MRPVRENIPHGPRRSATGNKSRPGRRVPNLNWRIAAAFQPHWQRVLAIGLLILVTAGLGVVNPILIRVVFDSALFAKGGPNLNLLWKIAAAMATVVVITGSLGVLQTWLTQQVGQRVMRDLRDRLYSHLQSLSLGFFTSQKTGEIQSRVANDVAGIRVVVTGTVGNILSNVVILISTLAAMAVLSWELTIVAAGITPVFAVFSYLVGRRRRAASALVQESTAEMTAITQETLSVSGVMLTRLFGAQNREILRFRDQNVRLSDLEIRREMTGQAVWAGMQIFFSLTPVVVYVLAGYILYGGVGQTGITAGTIVAFTTLQTRLYFPISTLLRTSVELQSSLALFERIFGYLDIRPDIVDAADAVEMPPERVAGRVELRDVRMNYHPATLLSEAYDIEADGQDFWALDGVSLEVKPGQLAALVGPSGAGKTTISYLIPRLYDATSGEISIDGVDVQRIRLESLARMIGYVSQESYLFHDSIRENLLYGNPEATEQQLQAAAKAAYIHDRVMEFPDGYDTVVGERGYRLSGGERQRLSIARVILHDPRLLILDEATSSLDTTSERYVQAALEPLMQGRTTIAIAHRLSTIMKADVIFVVDRGRVVERGTHYELLALGGLYAQLYDEQFEGGGVEYVSEDGVAVLAGGNLRLPVAI
jgi:ATP-binding cassette subfamily B protein